MATDNAPISCLSPIKCATSSPSRLRRTQDENNKPQLQVAVYDVPKPDGEQIDLPPTPPTAGAESTAAKKKPSAVPGSLPKLKLFSLSNKEQSVL